MLDYGLELEMIPGEKAQAMNQQIGNARFVRNDSLDTRIALYNEKKETLSPNEYKKEYLPKLKEENPFLKKPDKFALENAVRRVDTAFRNFFERVSQVRFPI